MTILNFSTQKQTFRFNNHLYSSFLEIETESQKYFYCLEQHQIVQLIVLNHQIIETSIIHDAFYDAHTPTTEEQRILNQAQKNLAGIHFTPFLCSQNNHCILMICHALIDDITQTQQFICLKITLNTKGYYEIIHLHYFL